MRTLDRERLFQAWADLRRFPIYEIEWVDSSVTGRWQHLEDISTAKTLLECRTVGYVVAETKKSIAIVHSVSRSSNPEGCCELIIPRCAITKIKRLR